MTNEEEKTFREEMSLWVKWREAQQGYSKRKGFDKGRPVLASSSLGISVTQETRGRGVCVRHKDCS